MGSDPPRLPRRCAKLRPVAVLLLWRANQELESMDASLERNVPQKRLEEAVLRDGWRELYTNAKRARPA